jgi:predicted dehydrogenase
MGDWGVHWLDQMMWWSGERAPKTVFCTGGRPIAGPAICSEKEQTTDVPDHQIASFEFEQFTATWEHRKFAENNSESHKIGAYFYGEKGVMHIGWRDGWTFHPANEKAQGMHGDAQLEEPDGHNIAQLWADFISAIEQRRKPVADIEIAHRSSSLPFLGMLSYKLGRSIAWDGEKEQVIGDAEANKLLSREYRKPWVYPAV